MTLGLRLPILYFPVLTVCTSVVKFSPSSRSGSVINSDGPVPNVIDMWLWATRGFFGKLVTSIRKWTIAQNPCAYSAASNLCIGFAAGKLSVVTRPHSDFTTSSDCSDSAGIVMSYATRVVARMSGSSVGTTSENIIVTLASEPLPSSTTGA